MLTLARATILNRDLKIHDGKRRRRLESEPEIWARLRFSRQMQTLKISENKKATTSLTLGTFVRTWMALFKLTRDLLLES